MFLVGNEYVSIDASQLIPVASVVLLGIAAASDIARRIIPDRVSAALAAFGALAGLLHGPRTLLLSAAVATALFATLAALHGRGLIGGGDVKLAAAIALGLPVGAFIGFLESTAFAGGALALVHLALRLADPRIAAAPRGSLPRRVLAVECWRIRRRGTLPYGVAIACGGALALLGWS